MSEILTYKMHMQFSDVIHVMVKQPLHHQHGGACWMAGEIVITFQDQSKAVIPFSTDHHKTPAEVPELVVSCSETDIASKFQEMQAKLAIIADTAKGYD